MTEWGGDWAELLEERVWALEEQIFLGLREGRPVRDAAVELANLRFDRRPEPEVIELVERSSAELTDERVAELAGRLIADFDPGFDLAPERWEALVSALRTVELDYRATGQKRNAEIGHRPQAVVGRNGRRRRDRRANCDQRVANRRDLTGDRHAGDPDRRGRLPDR